MQNCNFAFQGHPVLGRVRPGPRLRPRLLLPQLCPERRLRQPAPLPAAGALLPVEGLPPPPPQEHGQHGQGRDILPHQGERFRGEEAGGHQVNRTFRYYEGKGVNSNFSDFFDAKKSHAKVSLVLKGREY